MRAFHILALLLALLLSPLSSTAANKFISNHLQTLKTIFEAHQNTTTSHSSGLPFIVNKHSLKFLLNLHDDDYECDHLCEARLDKTIQKLNPKGDHSFMDWDSFASVITEIYGNKLTEDDDYPQEIHLALTAEDDEMSAMWVTVNEVTDPHVEYFLSSDDADNNDWSKATRSPATPKTYQVPKKWWPAFDGTIYSSVMKDLIQSSTYRYRMCGTSTTTSLLEVCSKAFEFKAKPALDSQRATTLAFMADAGTFELFGFKVVDSLESQMVPEALNIDLVMVAGDLSYAVLSTDFKPLNITKEDEFEHVWDLLGIQNEGVAATRPWMVGVGAL
jgi:hypothetical protein